MISDWGGEDVKGFNDVLRSQQALQKLEVQIFNRAKAVVDHKIVKEQVSQIREGGEDSQSKGG